MLRAQIVPVPSGVTAQAITFQHQVHGINGHAITHHTRNNYAQSLVHDGDYLITDCAQLAVGVLTADCAALLIADPVCRVVGAIHVGWRGLAGGIIPTVLAHMDNCFGTKAADMSIWCSPCAHACCYRVCADFIQQLPVFAQKYVLTRDHNYYFDLLHAVIEELTNNGVMVSHINTSLSKCTICNDQFCSYRRNAGASARQMSIIWIH